MTFDSTAQVVQVVATIDNIVSNDGYCSIVVGTFSQSIPIIANAKDSSCQINSIPANQATRGDAFTITVVSGGLTGTVLGKVR